MDESMGTVDEPVGASTRGGSLTKAAIDRRMMLKGAVAAGVIAGTWVAPRIDTLGFAPAAAAGTPCELTSAEAQDKNSNSGNNDCSPNPNNVPSGCCRVNFGNNGNTPDRWVFENPITGCTKLTVRLTGSTDCTSLDPDAGRMGLIIETAQTTGTTCGNCHIVGAVVFDSAGGKRSDELGEFMTGSLMCATGNGIKAEIPCNATTTINGQVVPVLQSDARLAVRISCIVDDGVCTPTV